MENIYYFPSCSSEPISLIHSFTPSLPVRHLETGDRGGGEGSSNKKGKERFMWVRLLTIVQERIPLALVDPTRVIDR